MAACPHIFHGACVVAHCTARCAAAAESQAAGCLTLGLACPLCRGPLLVPAAAQLAEHERRSLVTLYDFLAAA